MMNDVSGMVRLLRYLLALSGIGHKQEKIETLLPYAKRITDSILERHPEAKEALMEFLGLETDEELPQRLEEQLVTWME